MAKKQFVGAMLLSAGFINDEQLAEGLEIQEQTGKRIGDIFVEKGYITQQELMRVLENQQNVPYIDLDRHPVDLSMSRYVPVAIARRETLVPVKIENNVLFVAIEDPKNFPALGDVRAAARMEVQPMLASRRSIQTLVEKLYSSEYAERALSEFKREVNMDEVVSALNTDADSDVAGAPIVRLINALLEQAVGLGASDIHIEPMAKEVRVRMRVDGVLSSTMRTPRAAAGAMITRLKIMGNLNIAEKRLPQDGRFELNVLGHEIDVRLSTLPTVHGEKAVMRLLDRTSFLKPKDALGFTEENLKKFNGLLTTPHGIILVSGPTGSGKSTTLYTMLAEINSVKDNIVTVEDPVEYTLNGLNQVQVNPKANLDFAAGLRSILRQDPDIIMIGEIRDSETVEIAIRAAITGHLVLSTIHTNDAISTIFRLVDMGVPSYMVAASLVGVISQRLVRTICPSCKQRYEPTDTERELCGLEDDGESFYKGEGCTNCSNSGYKGRIAVHEVLIVDNLLRDMVHKGASLMELKNHALKNGMITMKEAALSLLRKGTTTIDEVIAITHGT